MHRYAREAWELGVRYIGGCCGFEAYHIRAVRYMGMHFVLISK